MASKASYLLLRTVRAKGACWLGSVRNIPYEEVQLGDGWVRARERLREGISFEGKFPKKALFEMDEELRRETRLDDAVANTSSALVVSQRLKDALEAIPGALEANEILPVKIVNIAGRAEKAPYYIVHQLDHPQCLDEKRSRGTRFSTSPESFQFLTKMVIDERKVPRARMLFRAAQFPKYPLVRRDLAEALAAHAWSGVALCELATCTDFLT